MKRNISRLFMLFSIAFIFNLVSCSNILKESENDVPQNNSDNSAYISVGKISFSDKTARSSIVPESEETLLSKLTNVGLICVWGSNTGSPVTKYITGTTWSEFIEQFASPGYPLQTGTYSFTLTANLDGVSFQGIKNDNITAGETKTLNFTLKPWDTTNNAEITTGGLNITWNLTGTPDYATITLSGSDPVNITSFPDNKLTYTKSSLAAGDYNLTVDFKSSNAALPVLSTWSGKVRVAAGITTTATIDWALDSVYTITWNLDGGTISDITYVQHERYTRRSNSITLPTDAQITHPDGYTFGGWYDNSGFTGDPITEIDFTNPSNIKPWNLHAKWVYKVVYKDSVNNDIDVLVQTYNKGEATTRPADNPTHTGYAFDDYYADAACTEDNEFTFGTVLTSNTTVYARFYNTLYVKYGGSSTAEGTRESASLDYIGTALDRIIEINQPADWIIQVSGSWDGHPYTLFRDTITTANASSITIQGKTGNDTDIISAGCTTKTTNGYVFNVVTAVPVTIKNIKITGAYVNGSGGGITVGANANVTLGEGALIQGNKAGTNGGGVYVAGNTESLGKLTILSGAEISGNSVDLSSNTNSGNGGGIYSKGIVVMKGGAVSGNSASRGGGVYLTKDSNNITSVFYMSGDACIGDSSSHTPYYASATNRSNYADGTNQDGGGIYIYAGSAKFGVTCNLDSDTFDIANIENFESDEPLSGGIYYNYASGYGGGIYSSSTTYGEANIVIKSGNISYNASGMGGGGLYFTSSTASLVSIVEMSGGTISQNYVPVGKKGGAVALSAGTQANTFLVMSGESNIPKSSDNNNYIAFISSNNTYGGIRISGALNSSGPFMLDAASCTTSNFNPSSLISKYGSISDSDFSAAVAKFQYSYVAMIGSTNYYTQKDAYDAILAAEGNKTITLGEACTGFMLGNSQTSSGNKLAYAIGNTAASTLVLYVDNAATIQLPADSSNMFMGCRTLSNIDLRHFDTSQVTKFDSMFEGCTNLREIDLSTFTNTSAASAISMFKGCDLLATIYATSNFDLSTKLDDTTGATIFNGCTSLQGGSGSTYTTYGDDYTCARLDSGSSSPGYFKSH